jgi:hypothetical protein
VLSIEGHMSQKSKQPLNERNRELQSPTLVNSALLDPALLTALGNGNPLALGAVAGVLDNSFIASLMGRPTDVLTERGERTNLLDDGPERADRVDNRSDRSAVPDGADLHAHGSLDATDADRANHAFWRSVAAGAEGMGMTNAARHMNHYLNNTGAAVRLDMDNLEANVPSVSENIEAAKTDAIDAAIDGLYAVGENEPRQWSMVKFNIQHRDSYIQKSDSSDWYFGMGGNTQSAQSRVAYQPGGETTGRLMFVMKYSVYDYYNWDEGKSVEIYGIPVSDQTLGRLHGVGLAQEFEMLGEREIGFEVPYTGAMPAYLDPIVDHPVSDPIDGRTDTTRERQ